MKYSLNGCWKVTHTEHQQDLSSMLTENFVPEGFLTAFVPEQIHATLRRYGIILGNTFDKEENADQWIEEADWIYYKEYYIPETWKLSQVTLHLQGLDTFCEIYLNGQKVGFSQNMHVPYSIDVRNLLRYNSRNVILLRFFSPVKFVADREQDGLFSITTSERLFARKAQMNYSWDFCGRCVSVGIWKDVFIESIDDPQITDYYIQTEEISEHQAQIGLLVNTDTLTCGNDPVADRAKEDISPRSKFHEYLRDQSITAPCCVHADFCHLIHRQRSADSGKNSGHLKNRRLCKTCAAAHIGYPRPLQ